MNVRRSPQLALSTTERVDRFAAVRDRFYGAGADFVIDRITELPKLVEQINKLKSHQETK